MNILISIFCIVPVVLLGIALAIQPLSREEVGEA